MNKHSVESALDAFITRMLDLQPTPPRMPYDEHWPSLCYQEDAVSGALVPWRPVRQTCPSDMFERLEAALGVSIHPDLIAFYCRYWSDPLPALCEEGNLSLLQVWNEQDMERLRSNLIGHAIALQKQKRPLTLFFACTEPDGEYFLSIDNSSGEVLLEKPGQKPLRTIAGSMAEFIDSLTPLTIPDMETLG